jgi:hypothetical protein
VVHATRLTATIVTARIDFIGASDSSNAGYRLPRADSSSAANTCKLPSAPRREAPHESKACLLGRPVQFYPGTVAPNFDPSDRMNLPQGAASCAVLPPRKQGDAATTALSHEALRQSALGIAIPLPWSNHAELCGRLLPAPEQSLPPTGRRRTDTPPPGPVVDRTRPAE